MFVSEWLLKQAGENQRHSGDLLILQNPRGTDTVHFAAAAHVVQPKTYITPIKAQKSPYMELKQFLDGLTGLTCILCQFTSDLVISVI